MVGKALITVIVVFCAASHVAAQIPASSPALDPDFVVLQPKEEFTGRYANQMVGSVIHTVAPLRWDIPEGGVFLNNVDTAGCTGSEIELKQPGGPFLQDNKFSLFSRALFRINGLRDPVMVFHRGKNEYPVMVGKAFDRLGTPFVFFYFPDSVGNYTDSIYGFTTKAFLLGGYGNTTGWAATDVDKDGFDDLFTAEEADKDQDDSTSIGLWYSKDIVFKNDTLHIGNNHFPYVPASREWAIPNRLRSEMQAADFDGDGAIDLSYLAERRVLTFVFGKTINNKWDIDTVITHQDSAIKSFKFIDFLYEDGIQDLLVGTDDTIFCFSGHTPNFLRNGFSFDDATFKIPSPAKLDPKNFKGNGKGMLYEWGWWMFNAGNVNGSGQHSLAVLCYLSPDTSTLGGPTYCFVYSGGKAADERADAVVADNSSIYVIFLNLDTVQTSDGSIGDILLGDPFYNNGRTGKLYYFKGRKDIPHKPNPKWSVTKNYTTTKPTIECSGVVRANVLEVRIHSSGYEDGELTVRDMLGRAVTRAPVHFIGSAERTLRIPVPEIAGGCYILQYIEGSEAVSKKLLMMRYSLTEPERRFLPDRYHLAPYLPEASLWAESSYTSRLWEALTLTEKQRKEYKQLRSERWQLSQDAYLERFRRIFPLPKEELYSGWW